jgi:hypothetical protein
MCEPSDAACAIREQADDIVGTGERGEALSDPAGPRPQFRLRSLYVFRTSTQCVRRAEREQRAAPSSRYEATVLEDIEDTHEAAALARDPVVSEAASPGALCVGHSRGTRRLRQR